MDQQTRRRVRARAGNRCEYCQLPQDWSPLARLQIEHIMPKKHGGTDNDDNWALACIHCTPHKGSNLTGIAPASRKTVRLFNPRTQQWDEESCRDGLRVAGLTPCGRTTVRVMNMNSDEMLYLRTAAADLE